MGNPQNAQFLCIPGEPTPVSCFSCSPTVRQPVSCDFVGFRQAYDILNQLLDEGITITSNITKVRPTFNTFGQLVTDIYTDSFSFATPGATVTLAGFTDPNYSALNGTYVNGVSRVQFGGVPNPSSKHVDYAASKMHKVFRPQEPGISFLATQGYIKHFCISPPSYIVK